MSADGMSAERDAGPADERDAGVSAERTGLAWRRTGLSASAVALLMLRHAFEPGAGSAIFLMVAVALLGWAMLVGIAYRRARGLRAWPPRPGQRTVRAYALVTVVLAATGTMLVML
ncbi:DUF202 domain-containing protein [Symbioplanes lichenis]|uniref:DUF202 domain-containing protein n=1 Tax=Symbioplanes lichenis TaxID=1629072 RepID=UPI0027395078|nr:DUF202 domain-containing protein [Actinoplanes lichenis]